jgi:hypothetical protein
MIDLQFRAFKLNTYKLLAFVHLAGAGTPAADLHLGIIGTGTSLAVAFTRALNNPAAPNYIPGARVVVAYKGGSPEIEESRSRVDGYASELHEEWGVHFVDTIPAMCSEVDGILLESLDRRLGTVLVDRPYSKFGAVAFRSNNRVDSLPDIKVDYIPLLREIIKFMATSKPPVENAETLELFQFLDAAQRSKTQNGSPIEMHSSTD